MYRAVSDIANEIPCSSRVSCSRIDLNIGRRVQTQLTGICKKLPNTKSLQVATAFAIVATVAIFLEGRGQACRGRN